MAKKGETLTKEYRDKISNGVKKQHQRQGHVGNHCPICGKKIVWGAKACMKHRIFSKEHREKISLGRRGKKHSIKTLLKFSEARKGKEPWNKGVPGPRGKDSPNWKNGHKRTRADIHTIEYQAWRKSIFERDNYTCQICGKSSNKLRAHHICRYVDFPLERLNIANGITLCRDCHLLVHRKDYNGPYLKSKC